MNKELFIQAITKFFAGLIIVALLLFVPAGSIRYWNGWLFIGVLFIPMFIAGLVMMRKDPELLKKRLNAKEKQAEQKAVIAFCGVIFASAFVVAGLNYRFGWIVMPAWKVAVATVIFLIAYVLYAEVLRENRYLSRTIEVQKDQVVVDTGLYGVVRHPMYAVTVFLFLSMPLILGSPFSFAIMLEYIPIIMKRIRNEESVLMKELKGYGVYCLKVKHRLIPFIW